MKTSLILRPAVSLAAIGIALAAHAASVSLVSAGSYAFDPIDSNLFTQDETVLLSAVSPLPALTTLHVDGVYSPFSTTATYSSGSGTLILDLAYENTSVGGVGVSTDSGTWTVSGGTGAYANMMGGGSYSISYNAGNNMFSSTTVVGDIQAVPEPATMTALSLGAIALLRRRKLSR